MRFALLLTGALLAASCGNDYSSVLPDGGRGLVNCDTKTLTVPVTVLDRAGKPAASATVQANYTSAAETENVVTNGNGVAVIEDLHGPGTVRVKANLNDLNSQVADITFVGTSCSEYASPRSVTLQLQ